MKGSLIIISFFIIGTLCGVYHLIPYDFTDSKLSFYALCGLMFCVGISIGNVPNPCNPEWKAATCPVCGQACWLQTGNAELVRQIYPNAKFVCSDCAWTGKAAANQ